MPRPSLDEIFGSTQTDSRPSLDEIFGKPKPQFSSIQEANAAMQEANAGQLAAQRNVENIDPLVSLGRSAYNLTWPVSAVANKLINQGSPVPEATTGGGALMQDLSAIANPMVNKAVGSTLNLAGKAVGSGLSNVGRAFGEMKQAFKLDRTLPSSKQLEAGIEGLKTSRQTLADKISLESQKVSMNKDLISSEISKSNDIFKKSFLDLKSGFDKTKQELTQLASKKSSEMAKGIKDSVAGVYKNASKAYGESLDNIYASIEDPIQSGGLLKKNATPVTRTEFLDKGNSILSEFANDPAIANTKSYKALSDLVRKYSPEGEATGLLDASGNAIRKELPESLDFRELIGDIRNMNKTLSSGFKSGSKAITPDELVAAKFNYAVGDIIKERVPEFAKLQASYKPVIDSKSLAYNIFKPGNELKTNTAEALFKRISTGKATTQDKQLVSIIEGGLDVGGKKVQGIGNVTKDLNDIADKLSKLGKGLEQSKKVITAKKELDIQTLSNVSSDMVKKFKTNKLAKTEEVIQLDNKLKALEETLKQRASVNELKKKAFKYALGTVSTGVGGKMVLDAATRK